MKSYVRIAAPSEQIARAEQNDHESDRDYPCDVSPRPHLIETIPRDVIEPANEIMQ
jgi:hypothetical protein